MYKKILFYLISFGVIASFIHIAITRAGNAQILNNFIETSLWNPPSPDPSGIAYNPLTNTLIISDGEVEEIFSLFKGKNVYESSLSGKLIRTLSTTNFSNEPTGVAISPNNNHYFFTDDDQRRVYEVDLGKDGIFGTWDDSRRYFSTSAFGNYDPEGIAYGQNNLYILDGSGAEVYKVEPGSNGIFDGVAPTGDDKVTHFDTRILGQTDPEGIDYNNESNTLFIVSHNNNSKVLEVTTSGQKVREIDIASFKLVAPAGIAYAPSSSNPSNMSLYIIDRGIDNNDDPKENDGKLFEIILSTPQSPPRNPSTLSLVPIEDTYVRSSMPDRNFGLTSTLHVDGSPFEISYLKFDLSHFFDKNIISAILRLKITNPSTSTQFIKAVEENSWSENSLTYSIRPQLSQNLNLISDSLFGTWKEVDITPYVSSKKGSLMSVGIDSTGSDGLDFYSKESSIDKPQLVIQYN